MRKVRGVKALAKYLESIDCPLSESTIYRLVKVHSIPFKRITPQVLIFDLNAIDKWLSIDEQEAVAD